MVLLVAMVLACAACESSPRPHAQSADRPDEPASTHADAGAIATPASAGAVGTDASPFDACVKDCVESRKMQAQPIEMIEADCRKACDEKKK